MKLLFKSLFLLMLWFPGFALAIGVGTVTHLSGLLTAKHADGTAKVLSIKSEIQEGDTLVTEKDTFARIKFVDDGEVVLRPETVFKVQTYSYNPDDKSKDSIVVSLIKGGMRSVTGLLGKRSADKFEMGTAVGTIGIRGTHYGALICDNNCGNIPTVSGAAPENGLHTDGATGIHTVTNAAGTVEVPAGSFSHTANANSLPKLVPPSQGVQVTMPPSISNNKDNGKGVGDGGGSSCTVK